MSNLLLNYFTRIRPDTSVQEVNLQARNTLPASEHFFNVKAEIIMKAATSSTTILKNEITKQFLDDKPEESQLVVGSINNIEALKSDHIQAGHSMLHAEILTRFHHIA